jgi:hypothetical protein
LVAQLVLAGPKAPTPPFQNTGATLKLYEPIFTEPPELTEHVGASTDGLPVNNE